MAKRPLKSSKTLSATTFAVLFGSAVAGACYSQGANVTQASSPDISAEEVVGLWSIRSVRAPQASCLLALQPPSKGGHGSVLVERCSLPEAQGAETWRLASEGFILSGSRGRALLTFRRTGVDAFEAEDGNGGVFHITRAPLA